MQVRVVVLAFVLAAAACEDTTIEPEAAPDSPETTRPSSVQEEAWRVAATAPSTTRVTVPTTPAPQTEGPLGTTFTVNPGDRKITAFAFRASVTPNNSFLKPDPGFQFAAADVQECAGATGERFSPNRFDFELAMADNTRIEPGVEVQLPQLASSPLQPGDCIRGWVSFEVPTSGTVRHIVYSAGRASAKWRVS